MADQPKLNSLDRFRKQPGRLVLEQYGSCEVPAGCGGVILRWRNPFAAQPVNLRIYAPVKGTWRIDEGTLGNGKIDLDPGRHVLTIALENVDLSAGLVMFAAQGSANRSHVTPPTEVSEKPWKVLTADDGTWKYTLDHQVTDNWISTSFDDHDWSALVKVPTPAQTSGDSNSYQASWCANEGADCLGLPVPLDPKERRSWWQRVLGRSVKKRSAPVTGNIWIRKVFDVPVPEMREPHA